MDENRILLIGFGNPGRRDDGLGPKLAESVERLAQPGVVVESDYQLTVEDAADLAKYAVVVFADADRAGPEPFWVKRIHPGPRRLSFSSHSISAEDVLGLAKDLFQAEPAAYLMGIRGYAFDEFGEGLSPKAQENLQAALAYWTAAIEKGFLETFQEIRADE
jgi:hydrogenase maturation protease